MGKYIYLEDKYSEPMVGLMIGLVGAALSNTPNGVVLDSEIVLVHKLNESGRTKFFEEYPEEYASFIKSKKSKRKLQNLLEAN